MNPFHNLARALTGPVGAALSAGMGIVFALVFAHYADGHPAEAINILSAVVIGVMVYLFFDSIFKSHEIGLLREQLGTHDTEIKRHEQELKGMISAHTTEVDAFFADVHPKLDAYMLHGQAGSRSVNGIIRLATKDAALRHVGMKRIMSYLNDFRIPSQENSIEFKSPASTLESFADFWDELIDMQEIRGNDNPITVLSTHVNAISLYSTRDADITARLLDQQSRFVAKGGRMFRLLIGKDMANDHETAAEYLVALERMEKRGIRAAYINIRQAEPPTRERSDDILVAMPMRYSIKWTRSSAGVLKDCCISQEESHFVEQVGIWNDLIGYVENYDYDKDSDTRSDINRFQAARDSLIQAYRSQNIPSLL